MHPLNLKIPSAGTPESIRANVQSALARGLPEFHPALVANDGTMICVGSGPSMPTFLEEIRQERERGRPIFAVKGAHDFLCQNGLEPELYINLDPNPATHPAHKVEGVNDSTTYLLASRCDPSMFDALKGRRIVLFHSWAPEEHCEEYVGKMVIGGGCTSGLRAIMLSYLMGFKKVILYGYDSCLAADRITKRFSGEMAKKDGVIDVIVNGKRFWANGAMAQQAQNFQDCFTLMPGIEIKAKGEGLIAAILEARKAIAA